MCSVKTEKKRKTRVLRDEGQGHGRFRLPSNVLAKLCAWFHDSTVFTPEESATGKEGVQIAVTDAVEMWKRSKIETGDVL